MAPDMANETVPIISKIKTNNSMSLSPEIHYPFMLSFFNGKSSESSEL
jgi:hypothetical protein